jgi:hypothetical protein
MKEFTKLLQAILDNDISTLNSPDNEVILPNIALRAMKTVNLVICDLLAERSPTSSSIRIWLTDCLPKLILVSSKVHTEFFSKVFDAFIERGRSHFPAGRNIRSATLSSLDLTVLLSTNLQLSYWLAVLNESLRVITGILSFQSDTKDRTIGMASLNISDKWCLISLLVGILKIAEPDTNFSFRPPGSSELPNAQISLDILRLRKIQLKVTILSVLKAIEIVTKVSSQDIYSMFLAHQLPTFLCDCLNLGSMHGGSVEINFTNQELFSPSPGVSSSIVEELVMYYRSLCRSIEPLSVPVVAIRAMRYIAQLQWIGQGPSVHFPVEGGLSDVADEDNLEWHEYENDTMSLRFRVHDALLESLLYPGKQKLLALNQLLVNADYKEVEDVIVLLLHLVKHTIRGPSQFLDQKAGADSQQSKLIDRQTFLNSLASSFLTGSSARDHRTTLSSRLAYEMPFSDTSPVAVLMKVVLSCSHEKLTTQSALSALAFLYEASSASMIHGGESFGSNIMHDVQIGIVVKHSVARLQDSTSVSVKFVNLFFLSKVGRFLFSGKHGVEDQEMTELRSLLYSKSTLVAATEFLSAGNKLSDAPQVIWGHEGGQRSVGSLDCVVELIVGFLDAPGKSSLPTISQDLASSVCKCINKGEGAELSPVGSIFVLRFIKSYIESLMRYKHSREVLEFLRQHSGLSTIPLICRMSHLTASHQWELLHEIAVPIGANGSHSGQGFVDEYLFVSSNIVKIALLAVSMEIGNGTDTVVHGVLDMIYRLDILACFFMALRRYHAKLSAVTLAHLTGVLSELVLTSSRFVHQFVSVGGMRILDDVGIFSGPLVQDEIRRDAGREGTCAIDVLISALQMASHLARVADSGPSYDLLDDIFTPEKLAFLLTHSDSTVRHVLQLYLLLIFNLC